MTINKTIEKTILTELDNLISKGYLINHLERLKNYIKVEYSDYASIGTLTISISILHITSTESLSFLTQPTLTNCSNLMSGMLYDIQSKLINLTMDDFVYLKTHNLLNSYVTYYDNLPATLRNKTSTFYIRILM